MRFQKPISYLIILIVVTAISALTLNQLVTRYLVSQAEEQIHNANYTHRALHLYIQKIMHPEYFRARDAGEIPTTYYSPEILSSSYVVREMHEFFNQVRIEHGDSEVYYKIAADNPRNPKNKADAHESKLIRFFNENRGIKEFREVSNFDGKDYLVYATPFLENNKACLRCHGERKDAPEGLQMRYPGEGGFSEQVGIIRAVESIRVPVGATYSTAQIVTTSLVAGVLVVLLLIYHNMRLRNRVQLQTADLRQEIEQRKRSEEDLRESNETLEQAVHIAETLAEDARRASEVKSLFLANMSHELRTPLTGLLGMIELVEQDEIDQEKASMLRTASECGWNLLDILNDILDLTLIEAEKLILRPVPVHLQSFVEKAISIVRPISNKKALQIESRFADELPEWIKIDELRLRQIILNLLGNAIKFTPQGTITLNLNRKIRTNGAIALILCVTDTGVGIDPEDMERIFEPFTQGDLSNTKRYKGAGLGLTIVKRLCEAMGGEVIIESTPGIGTKLCIELPVDVVVVATPQPTDQEFPPQNKEDCVSEYRVLVVEDNPINLLLLKKVLEKLQCRVDTAECGLDALARLATNRYNMVLLDIQLPDIDGIEVLLRIRSGQAKSLDQSVPVIAVTACSMAGDRERLLAAGMDDYIAKPINMKIVADVVKKYRHRNVE